MIQRLWRSTRRCDSESICRMKSRFSLSNQEAITLENAILVFLAHTDEKENLAKMIEILLPGHVKMEDAEKMAVDCHVIAKYYERRDGKWMWQEDLFCILAYLFTLLSLSIEVIDAFDWLVSANDPNREAFLLGVLQLIAIGILIFLWIVMDHFYRGNRGLRAYFIAANRFMPSLTMVVYFLFYYFKFMFLYQTVQLIRLGMVLLLVFYVAYGAIETVRRYRRYCELKPLIKQVERDRSIQ